MITWHFSQYNPGDNLRSPFEQLLDLFQQLLTATSGNVEEALSWLTEIDNHYNITTPEYGMGNFIEQIIRDGYIIEDKHKQALSLSSKMEAFIRKQSLEQVFGLLKKAKKGNHHTNINGVGSQFNSDLKPYQFGDEISNISITQSIRNAHINHGIDNFSITHDDLIVKNTQYQTQTSTVLMIDISHSMILYGEDRITPAKRVAMALSELITTRYPKDTLDIIVFGNDAWQIKIKDLPYLEVGPFHTNTVAGLDLAMELLRKKRNPNKQIFMITDGKPTCLKIGKKYYKNPYGADNKILNRTFNKAKQCRKMEIPITTFMIANDPSLLQFVEKFTSINNGKAFYSSLDGLGEFIFRDYKNNKKGHR